VTSATVPITGNACLKPASATPLKGKLLMPMIHGPALLVSIWIKMNRKAVSTFRKERLWKSHGTQPGSQKNYKTRAKASGRASINLKSISPRQTYLSPHQTNTYMIFKNKGSLPLKRATSTNPTMSFFGTKLALTSNPPTHRLTLRPQGTVSTGSQPLTSWSLKKKILCPRQMTLYSLKCTLTQ